MTRRLLLPLALWTLLWAAASLAQAETGRYSVQPGDGTNITFTSKAPLEAFKGRTGQVTGRLTVDLGHLAGDIDFQVAVDLASFDTGLAKRNKHMRENHLETDKYPQAIFRGGKITSQATALVPGGSARFTVAGELDLHGVVRPLSCQVTVRDLGAGRLRVETGFSVKLSDHRIKRPRFLVMKLADEQQVKVILTMKEQL